MFMVQGQCYFPFCRSRRAASREPEFLKGRFCFTKRSRLWLVLEKLEPLLVGLLLAVGSAEGGKVCAAPVITSFSPEFGAAGTSVTLAGSDFSGVTQVRFGEALSIFTISSSSRIVATVPLEATTGVLTLNAPSGSGVSPKPFRAAPQIQDFLPASGSPGALVVVRGLNFDGAESVEFNGTNAPFEVTAPSRLEAVLPAGAKSGPIRVSTPVGSATSTGSFLVTTNQPFISGFSPMSGAPNTVVLIDGINLSGTTAVWFNTIRATSVSAMSSNQVKVIVPPAAASGPISLATAKGTNTSSAEFVVTTAPVVNLIQPIAASAGTDVVISGKGFLGATAVTFNGKSATQFKVNSDTQIRVTVPTGATTGPVMVSTPNGTGMSTFSFTSGTGPIITGFSPSLGRPGTYVAVNGLNFTQVQSVKFGKVTAEFDLTAATQILAVVPNGATNGPITVTTKDGTAQSRDSFLVETGKPIITSFDPPAGLPTSGVQISGADFTGTRAVKFGGIDADFTVLLDTVIEAFVPAGAITGPISVQTASGTTSTTSSFVAAPSIASFTPASGVAGAKVTIRGTNLTDLLSVRIGSTPAAFTNRSANEIIATVPPDAIPAPINVTSPAGIVASLSAFSVAPFVEGFSPSKGPSGTRVTINGTGLYDVKSVTFGGVASAEFTTGSVRQVMASVPPGATTGPIRITTATGSSSSSQAFVLAALADLAVTHTQSPDPVLQNQVFSYTLTVRNGGPSDATLLTLSNTLPTDLLFLSATVSDGTLSRAGQNLCVQLPRLPNGGTVELTASVMALRTGSITNLSNVSGAEEDPELRDNATTQITPVLVNGAVLRVGQMAPDQVRLSWPTTAAGFVPEATLILSPAEWIPINATPVIVGSENVIITDAQTEKVFYRLRKP